jgi:DNA-directed RNA polymerase specialized sigma24 family protein
MTELHPSIYDIAPSVAYTVYRRYKKYVDKDDIKQECLMWAMTRIEYINFQLSEPNVEQRKHNEQKVAWQMLRVAERYARKEKASRSGYQLGDEAYYERATLAQLLPFVIASIIDGTVLEQAQEMVKDGQPRGSSSPAEGGNLLAILLDIKKGYLKLDTEEQQLLVWRHHENLTLAQIAAILECAVSTADRRCINALRALQKHLGGENPFR